MDQGIFLYKVTAYMKSGGMENTLMDKTGIQNDLDTLDKRSEEK